MMPLVGRYLPFLPPLHSGAAPLSPHFTPIGSQASLLRAAQISQPNTLLIKRNLALTSGIVRHDYHLQKSGGTRPGIEPGSPRWEASRLTAQPPADRAMLFEQEEGEDDARDISEEGKSSMEQRRNERVGKRQIPEKTRRPAASPGTITICDIPGSHPAGNRTRLP
ncbi:hypothetical protein PR048_002165 [Dryococelus australis]|uniref:Uncharacterized protein n=1 Tax=Dryococelus australis TaxID=614101 RepID=A0ABQ9IJJ6_9NEOP|nr:hypothetical protein PR048_002165 [Dryococelus australis]